jgi:hypothetical protein
MIVGQTLWGVKAVIQGQGYAWWSGKVEGWRAWQSRRPAADSPEALFRASERQLRDYARDWFWKVNAWMI